MNFTFYVCVCPRHAISLLFEAASCVLSEKHSLLAAQSAPLLCSSLPSISFLLRKAYDRMWFLVFMSSVCRSYFDIFTSHFLLGGWGVLSLFSMTYEGQCERHFFILLPQHVFVLSLEFVPPLFQVSSIV